MWDQFDQDFYIEQLGDSFNKGLPKPGFDHLEKKLMEWKWSSTLMLAREC